MDENELKECRRIHGYFSSEEESDDESKTKLDEIYREYKPPPIKIDARTHKIIEIVAENTTKMEVDKKRQTDGYFSGENLERDQTHTVKNANTVLTKSQKKRMRRNKTNKGNALMNALDKENFQFCDKISQTDKNENIIYPMADCTSFCSQDFGEFFEITENNVSRRQKKRLMKIKQESGAVDENLNELLQTHDNERKTFQDVTGKKTQQLSSLYQSQKDKDTESLKENLKVVLSKSQKKRLRRKKTGGRSDEVLLHTPTPVEKITENGWIEIRKTTRRLVDQFEQKNLKAHTKSRSKKTHHEIFHDENHIIFSSSSFAQKDECKIPKNGINESVDSSSSTKKTYADILKSSYQRPKTKVESKVQNLKKRKKKGSKKNISWTRI